MDHSISQLDECIFDYLVSHVDEPKNFTQIYNDISSTHGHRCSELNNIPNRNLYKQRFLTTCHTIDNTYDNIHKIFKNDVAFLMYSTKSKSEINTTFNNYSGLFAEVHQSPDFNDFGTNDFDGMIDYLLDNTSAYKNFNFSSPISSTENMLQFIVKNNKVDKLKKILDQYDIDLTETVNGKSLIDIASEQNSTQVLRYLLDYTSSKKILILQTQLLATKQNNTTLRNNNAILILKNKTQNNNLQWMCIYRLLLFFSVVFNVIFVFSLF